MVIQTITSLVIGVADMSYTHAHTHAHSHAHTYTTIPPAQNKNKNKPWESEDAGEKVMKQGLLEPRSEVAGLNSQVVSPATSRALPTLKSFRTRSRHSRFFRKVDSGSINLPSPL